MRRFLARVALLGSLALGAGATPPLATPRAHAADGIPDQAVAPKTPKPLVDD